MFHASILSGNGYRIDDVMNRRYSWKETITMNRLTGNKRMAALATIALIFTLGVSAIAIDLGSVVKLGGMAYVVTQFGPQINKGINAVLSNKGGLQEATKVVPILSVGQGGYVGAVQVVGAKKNVDKCQAVVLVEIDKTFGVPVRIRAYVPVSVKSVSNIKRLKGVGVSAIVDLHL